MPSDFSFRLSMYLSLALACACLGYAEADLLPSGAVIAGLVVVLLAVAFRSEGRFELGLAAANRLGVVLFVAAAVWLVTQFANRSSLLYTVPWPASLLPYVGTMLLVAMPAKLLRPKHAGDWWAIQGMGLAAVTLACALAESGMFGVLLALYAVAAVGGLSLFYVKREAGQVPPAARDPWLVGTVEWLLGRNLGGGAVPPPAVVASAPARVRAAWRPAVGWVAVAAAVALPLFFLTPRSGGPRWSMGGTSLETGYDSPQMVDLTRTGDLRVNTDTAFEVVVTDAAGRPFDELRMTQRWRGVSYSQYEAGVWRGVTQDRFIDSSSQAVADQTPSSVPPPRPPLRRGMSMAVYAPRAKTLQPAAAEPVRWEAGAGSPVWVADRSGRPADGQFWLQKPDAAFNALYPVPAGRPGYVQYIYPPADGDPDLGTGFDPDSFDPTRSPLGALGGGSLLRADPLDGTDPARTLRELPAGLKELPLRTRRLLDDLVAAGKLPARVTGSAGFRRDSRPEPADWEAVAGAFRDHLANGTYEYTLKLRRQDRQSDPIEDFLYRTKAGNCERFAAGLVLLCRAVGVPARYVLGFKGHESVGGGKYLVRQDHTHAWVEVLVPRRAATPAGFRWHWLSVDPTPDGGADADPAASLLGAAAQGGRSFFNDFIVGYNAERQRRAVVTVTTTVESEQFLAGVGLVVVTFGMAWGGWLAWKRFRRQTALLPPAVGWYDRLIHTLTAAGHPVTDGQTPAEHVRAVQHLLPLQIAALPRELTELYYRERFGGRSPSADDLARIDADLRRLEVALPAR